jgi:hypothetical protein
MNFQNKKKILRAILLFIGVIIIALSLFYLYNYLDNNHEGFLTTQDIYQPYYTGEPTNTNTNNLPVLTSTQTYYLNGLQAITTNNKQIYALLQNSAGQTLISYYKTTSTPNAWVNLALATNTNVTQPNVINKINPSITNPKYDTSTIIQCYSTNGLILKANQTTVFYYNGGTNNSDNIDCLYYMNLNNDGSISSNGSATLNCLKLPILVQSRILPTSSGSTSPSMNFDKLKILATNQNILFALGCSGGNTGNNNLYYCNLTNGAPPNNNANNWKTKQISKANYTINNIYANDSCIFIYYSQTTTNNKEIYYSQITIDNSSGDLSLNLQLFGDSSSTSAPAYKLSDSSVINFNNITVNNDVFWSLDSFNNKLWWFALQNGIPAPGTLNYKWQSYDITSLDTSGNSFPIISGIIDMILYQNTLIVFGSNNNLIIPLYNSSSSSSTTTPNPTGTGTTTPNPTGTGTTTPNPTGTGTTTPNPIGTGTTTPNPTGTGTTTPNPTGTGTTTPNPIGTGTTTSNPTGTGTTTPNPTGTGTTTPNPTGTGTTTPNPTGTGTTTPNPTGTGTTTPTITRARMASGLSTYNPVQELLSEMNLSNFFGNNNSASNLYISPMNNSNLYNPTNANKIARIDSAFFPIVKIS